MFLFSLILFPVITRESCHPAIVYRVIIPLAISKSNPVLTLLRCDEVDRWRRLHQTKAEEGRHAKPSWSIHFTSSSRVTN